MAESVHRAMKQRYHQANAVAAVSSMELMRQNVQNAFDRDIDLIIKKYVDVKEVYMEIMLILVLNISTFFRIF